MMMKKVRPVIMLDDIETLGIDEDGNFCRADLKTYCDGLLQQNLFRYLSYFK